MLVHAIETLSGLSDLKDSYLTKHQQNVCLYSAVLLKTLHLPGDLFETIRQSALLHDIGKIGIPNSILFRPGRLTHNEWEIMRLHPVTGAELLSNRNGNLNPFVNNEVINGVKSHHERWDGAGYPDGLKGEDIPLVARIIAVADAYDAMTSNRPYRKALPKEEAAKEIIRCSGKQFDPRVVALFLNTNVTF